MRSVAQRALLAHVVVAVGCSVYEPTQIPGGGGGSGGAVVSTTATGASSGASSTTTGGAGEGGSTSSGGSAGDGGAAGSGSSAGGAAGTGGASGGSGGASGGSAGAGGAIVDAGRETGSAGAGDADASCPVETEDAFCTRLMKNCGMFTAIDSCGVVRVATCGACAGTSTCAGGGTLNVCSGGGPVNRARGGTITASIPTDFKATENRDKLFDGDVATKWYVPASPTPWIAYQFASGAAYAITSYTLTSANDVPTRDPKSWRLEGTNDPTMTTWTVLDTRTDETFAARYQTNTYSFTNATAYTAYRFFVVANAGATAFQLAELQLFGL